MPIDTTIEHRLYMKQFNLLKSGESDELLPLNFNYQDIIIVATGTLESEGQRFVYQTYSCGCGPQPAIRGALLESELSWEESAIRGKLEQEEDSLAAQQVVRSVYRIRRPGSEQEKQEIVRVLRKHFGENKKIGLL